MQVPARAWLALLGASLALFCTVGFLNAFGVFQEYYTTYLRGQRSSSDISWIGSLSIFLLYAVSPSAGFSWTGSGPPSRYASAASGCYSPCS
ncbi:hypothetical protein PG997_005447 [Apiospora hydei]|uniref:Uncharacterized protein n=1 Tax=Apiospora hydei TaxID=1337664 RepID=A0ABR1X4Y7_9PEZI